MSCKKIWLADQSMDTCARQRRVVTTFSAINQSLLPNRSGMSLERVQPLFPQSPRADHSHLRRNRECVPARLGAVNSTAGSEFSRILPMGHRAKRKYNYWRVVIV